jgi:hypothetical protein
MDKLFLPLFCSGLLFACQPSEPTEVPSSPPTLETWMFSEDVSSPPGLPAVSADEWSNTLQPQILNHFEQEVYGSLPDAGLLLGEEKILEGPTEVFDGKGYRTQVALTMEGKGEEQRQIHLLIYYPTEVKERGSTVLLNLNFMGNQATSDAPEIIPSDNDVYASRSEERGIVDLRPTDKNRGISSHRLPVEYLIDEGLAVITAGYQDFLPDDDPAAREMMQDFYALEPENTGAISIWARGFHWLADYAQRQSLFPVKTIVATGHSRLGKAVLWAAATDDRIQAVHVNNSGCGGAALFRRAEGETIAAITGRFPHWFRDKFHGWAERDSLIPLDQDWLLASLAPRKVLVASAQEDAWADPEGEFLALRGALPAYRAFDEVAGLSEEWPAPQDAHAHGTGNLAYHLRQGPHDLRESDYRAFVALLNR